MTQSPPVERSVSPLLGRAGVFAQRKIFQFFTVIRDAGGALVAPTDFVYPQGWNNDYLPQSPGECGDGLAPRKHKCERLHRLGTAMQIGYRESLIAVINPLTPEQFNAFDDGAAVAAGSVTGGRDYWRVRVEATTVMGKTIFFMDVGQHLELYAFQVKMVLVGPPNAVLITADNEASGPNPAQLSGLVQDIRIGGRIEPVEASTGLRDVIFTQWVNVAAGAQVTLPVPKFATRVKIIQDSLGAASGPWDRLVGPPAIALNVGTVAFAGRASREEDRFVGRESSIRTDINALNARLFQVIWTLRP